VRQALLAGVHVCTVPFGVMQHLCDNSLTEVGAAQFREHTQLMTVKVRSVVRPENPVCAESDTLASAMVRMTESRLGVVTIVDARGEVAGVFTDGDLRRRLQQDGRRILDETLAEIGYTRSPVTIPGDSLLNEAVKLLKEFQVDSIVVVDGRSPIGVLDVQDIVRLGLLGPERS
jgi:transaldolase